ncbi:hypothetical protein Afil01_01110 [Actinorhabdospora filicis]|uniref:Uncharacterized protein n=1 Tax=Actinorhabdospora filicis TaxID=1785913 RepID=A0A9W6W683_9ACTN|nr:hypothetical protein [Actinorhabdospora filicis]GLZ75304.1 hypothetical protein Afil01_01110 [Actinorhabdospora filicis]
MSPASRELRREHRLRLATYATAAVLAIGFVPMLLLAREAGEDPVFADLDDLALPGWAATSTADAATGNRWCVGECRTRERTWTSARTLPETRDAFAEALREEGWEPLLLEGCPPGVDVVGSYACWSRDEYVLDLWIRPVPCDVTDLAARDKCSGALATAVVRDRVADPRPVGGSGREERAMGVRRSGPPT